MPAADLPERVREALKNVIDYSWDSEFDSAQEYAKEGSDLADHIFSDLVCLRNFLLGKHDTAEELVSDEEDYLDDEEEDDDDDDADDGID